MLAQGGKEEICSNSQEVFLETEGQKWYLVSEDRSRSLEGHRTASLAPSSISLSILDSSLPLSLHGGKMDPQGSLYYRQSHMQRWIWPSSIPAARGENLFGPAWVTRPLSLVHLPLAQGTGWGSQNRGLLPEKQDPGGLLWGRPPRRALPSAAACGPKSWRGSDSVTPKRSLVNPLKETQVSDPANPDLFVYRSGLGRKLHEGRILWPAHHSSLVPCP